MKLFNQNTIRVGNFKTIEGANGETLYTNKLTEEQLNSLGYYFLEYGSLPNRRYYNYTTTSELLGNKYTISYIPIDRPIEDVKKSMITDLFIRGEEKEKEAIIDTGFGFSVPATESDLNKFERGSKRGWLEARDISGNPHKITKPEMESIALAIEDNGKLIFDTKWKKFDEIMSLSTVADCELYEATPYDYVVTQEDVDADIEGTLTVGDIILKTKNNVKEW